MRLALLCVALALNPGCECKDLDAAAPPITTAFADDFNRATLGADWLDTSDDHAYRIVDGELVVRGAYNHPLWLKRAIPRDAVIEVDCWSGDDAGDLKVESWGDGKSYATGDRTAAYTSTSYNFIFGGWHNSLSTLARMHEHGADRQTRNTPRVEKGRRYHWRIARQGSRVDWQIDGQPFLSFDDPSPLDGNDHRFFSFNDWEAELHFEPEDHAA